MQNSGVTLRAESQLFATMHDERVGGKGSRGLHVITPTVEDLQQAHLYMFNNSDEVLPYILCHEGLVKQSVATYPPAGGRRVTRGCVFQKRNTRGVATNVYLRKTSEKPEKT